MDQIALQTQFEELTGLTQGLKLTHPHKSLVNIPRLINQLYRMTEGEVLGLPFLIAETETEEPDIRKIKAHESLMSEVGKKPVLFVFEHLKQYQIKALTSQKINFLDMSGNIFVPDALLAVRKQKDHAPTLRPSLTTWATVTLLKQLLNESLNGATVSELAKELGISKMHASRLVAELVSFGLVKAKKEGVSKRVQFLDKKSIWNRALNLMQNPVSQKIFTQVDSLNGKLAGLTALGEMTLLEAGKPRTIALSKKDYSKIKNKVIPVPQEIADCCLELWDWDPKLLTAEKIVDPLSLYLSLRQETDDRIQIALADMLKEKLGV